MNYYKPLVLNFVLIILVSKITVAQDTIVYEEPYMYNKGPNFNSRLFYSINKYGRQDILYSDTNRTIEYCYYLDDKKNCFSEDYTILNDSTLRIITWDTIEWSFRQVRDSLYEIRRYRLYDRTQDSLLLSGYARSLIPLRIIGNLYTISDKRIDTLWYQDFSYYPHVPWGQPHTELYVSMVPKNLIENKSGLTPPKYPTGENFNLFRWKRYGGCYNDPYNIVYSAKMIVTKHGRIVNPRQIHGNLGLGCNTYEDFLLHLYKLQPLIPATKNGEPIDVEWEFRVETY